MKKLLLLIPTILISFEALCQGLIGTPTSLILVYNNPDNYFYIQLDGIDKRKTEKPTVFIIDKKPVQVLVLNKNKFLPPDYKSKSQSDIIKDYIKWESDYLKSTFKFDINNKIETLKTIANTEVFFWTYDMPTREPKYKTDSIRTTPTQKQMFVLRLVKDYVVGINTPLFDNDQYENNKAYLLKNIDNIVVSNKEIDLEELNKQVNKQ
jgi:hypothetical protein